MKNRSINTGVLVAATLAVSGCTGEQPLAPLDTTQSSPNFSQSSSNGVRKVKGHGRTGVVVTNPDLINLVFTIDAKLYKNGRVKGHVDILGNGGGPVVEVVPPQGAIDFWCVTVEEDLLGLPGFLFNVSVRDIGDGKTSFDEINLHHSFPSPTSCTAVPIPPKPFEPLVEGDFKTK